MLSIVVPFSTWVTFSSVNILSPETKEPNVLGLLPPGSPKPPRLALFRPSVSKAIRLHLLY